MDTTISTQALRERWMPVVQLLAQNYGWTFVNNQLDAFVDAVLPYLVGTTPHDTSRVVYNFYHEARLVQALRDNTLFENDTRQRITNGIGETLRASCPQQQQAAVLQHVMERIQRELEHYTYHRPLQMVIADIVQEEIDEYSSS